jgi:hypothetical protein
MKNTRVNVDSVYDTIKLRRKYNTASNEKISLPKTVFNVMKLVNERI